MSEMGSPALTWTLHNLAGRQLCGAPRALSGSAVVVPVSDSRTGTLTISMYDPAAAHVAPGRVAVKCRYGDALILWGVMLTPSFDFAAGVITIPVHDPTIRLKKRFMGRGMSSVLAQGVTLDGVGARMLVHDCETPAGLLARGAPSLGILTTGGGSFDWVAPQPAVSPVRQAVSAGDCAWDDLQELVTGGIDIDFPPIDSARPSWTPGQMTDMVTWPQQGVDRSAGNTHHNRCVKFVYAKGNALVWAPDMNSVINWSVRTVSDGSSAQSAIIGSKYDADSIIAYGIYQAWQSDSAVTDNASAQSLLQTHAGYDVFSYGTPPDFLTLTCATDQLTQAGMIYPYAFAVGDVVQLEASKGYCTVSFAARIVTVTVSQVDNDGNTSLALTFVPVVGDRTVTTGAPS